MITRVFAVVTMVLSLFVFVTNSVAQSTTPKEDDGFGDMFVHPRDSRYLPGTAPSRAVVFDFNEQMTDSRGSVARWEYRKGNQVILREVWIDEQGRTRGSFRIGKKF